MLKISYNLFHGCQPWRVIAMPLSGRVAEEMDVTIVKQVDYGIRFEDYSSHKAVLKLHNAQAGTQHTHKAIFKDESTVGFDTLMPDAEHNQLPKQHEKGQTWCSW